MILLLLLLLCSCGYRFEESPETTLSIPFVQGDWDGALTSAIVEQVGRSGQYTYRREGGALILRVELMDLDDKNIGFRYDRDKKGHLRHSIIPTETRLTGDVQVTLIEAASGRALLGPICLTANVDFDHDYESPLHSINVFSLGQLTDYDDAYEAAERPLNRALAEKIVDFISDSW